MKHLNILFFFFFLSYAYGQQIPLFSQYRETQGVLNPATVSINYLQYNYNMSFGAAYRNQWTSTENAPSTQAIHGEYFYENRGFSILSGGYLLNDKVGRIGTSAINGRIAGVFSPDPDEWGISAGIGLGVANYRLDVVGIKARNDNDPLLQDNQNLWLPDANLGFYYYQKLSSGALDGDILYAGASIPQLFSLNLTQREASTGRFRYDREPHYYANAGYVKSLRDEFSFIEFASWVKYFPKAPLNADFSCRYQFSNSIWLGGGYNTASILHAELGLVFGENIGLDNQFRICYLYDYPFTSTAVQFGSTHEISLTYALHR